MAAASCARFAAKGECPACSPASRWACSVSDSGCRLAASVVGIGTVLSSIPGGASVLASGKQRHPAPGVVRLEVVDVAGDAFDQPVAGLLAAAQPLLVAAQRGPREGQVPGVQEPDGARLVAAR